MTMERFTKSFIELRRRRGVRQLIKFSIVGTFNTGVDWVFYLLFTRWFGIYYLIAKILSFLISSASAFVMNRRWTFRSDNPRVRRQYFKFMIANVCGLGINSLMMYVSVGVFHLWDIWGLIIATSCSMLWNFFVNKFWVFR
ncbi:MAG: GtrA family protein [Candidatus Berkelbacteria bacterium Licking1014_2]|uniref:GtrA family protein n=1 Tax=Candidatus Berkelbacteria bacterium Licking1014_2 TaxID=2017146 RepID=A0A554LWE0_9BACT|nr:MAG: GtrA family protein [Candidatus Berkelbacteria bacterium Licking1014_2]